MQDTRKTNQGGSVASIIIVGVILAVLLIGSIFVVKQRGDSARKQQAISDYEKQQAAKKQQEKNQAEEEVLGSNLGDGEAELSLDASTDNLPNTGPESSLIDAIGVFLLAISIFSYSGSKRYVLRHL